MIPIELVCAKWEEYSSPCPCESQPLHCGILTMTDAPSTVLDHIDNIIVPGNVFKEPTNEYWALLCLRDGLELLYHQAARCDEMVKQQVNPQDKLQFKFMGFGNLPAFN